MAKKPAQSNIDLGAEETIPVLPLRDIVVFPHMIVPLFVGREKSIRALEEVMREEKRILLVAQKNPGDEDPTLDSIYDVGTVAQVMQLSRMNSDDLAREMSVTQGVLVGNRCNALLDEIRKSLKLRIADESRDVSASAQMGRTVVISTGVFGGLLSLVLAMFAIRSITRPVGHGVKVFEAIAQGDLTRRMNLDRHDEIGRMGAASDQMANVLCSVVTQIRDVAESLGGSAGDLSGVSTDLLTQSQQMTTQAESVAAGTEQMSTNVSTMAAAANWTVGPDADDPAAPGKAASGTRRGRLALLQIAGTHHQH